MSECTPLTTSFSAWPSSPSWCLHTRNTVFIIIRLLTENKTTICWADDITTNAFICIWGLASDNLLPGLLKTQTQICSWPRVENQLDTAVKAVKLSCPYVRVGRSSSKTSMFTPQRTRRQPFEPSNKHFISPARGGIRLSYDLLLLRKFNNRLCSNELKILVQLEPALLSCCRRPWLALRRVSLAGWSWLVVPPTKLGFREDDVSCSWFDCQKQNDAI